jgi:outer membrane protein
MRSKLCIWVTCLLAVVHTQAQPPQARLSMSLNDCLEYAEKNQVKIKKSLLDQQLTDAQNKEVTGLALPQLSAKGGINYAPLVAAFVVPNFMKEMIAGNPAAGADGMVKQSSLNTNVVNAMPDQLMMAFQPKWTTTGTLEASQLLFDPSVMVALQARRTLEEMAAKNVSLTVQDIKVAVSKSYYNVLVAEKQKVLIEQNIARMNLMKFETEEIYKNGFAEKIDVDRITVTLNNLETQKVKIDQAIRLAYLSLKFQMGMPLTTELVLTDSLSDKQIDSDILQAKFEPGMRIEYQLMETQNRLLAYDLKRYKLAWLPTFSVFGNYGYTLYNMNKLMERGDSWQKSAILGANLNFPLFTGFQRKQKARQASLALQKNQEETYNLKMALELENENARITLKNNLLTLGNQKENMLLAEEIYNTARIKYKEGVGSSLEIMNAESALKEAQTNYFTALYEVIASRVDLQKALGQIK